MNCRQKLYLHRTVGRYNKDLKQHRWRKYNLNIDVRCITLYMAFTQLNCPLDDFKYKRQKVLNLQREFRNGEACGTQNGRMGQFLQDKKASFVQDICVIPVPPTIQV